MEKEYYTKMMWKVVTIKSGECSTSLFENKREAEFFQQYMEAKGIDTSLNRWTWEVKIEK